MAMVNAAKDLEKTAQLRSWRDKVVLSAVRARENGYHHTADALDAILREEINLISSMPMQFDGWSGYYLWRASASPRQNYC